MELGNRFDGDTQSGPLISAEHCDKVVNYVEIGQKEGAYNSRPNAP
ncbi:aldehyde dehydrogenase family protein [Halobacillus andaensis]